MRKNWIFIISLTLAFMIVATGCSKGEPSSIEMDPPQDLEGNNDPSDDNHDENESTDEEEDLMTEMVPRKLYLMDVNGLLAEQILELPQMESKEVATQVLNYLIKGGPITPILPNGFQAVLPEGTEVLGLNLQEDGTLVVDLSEEFKEYEADHELQVLQSLTYTLTQFDNIDEIQLRINGHPQEVMPVDGTPIGNGYSRLNGINIMESGTIDFMTSRAVTMYFPTEYNDNRYYVPVTKYISDQDNEAEMYQEIIQSLLEGPGYRTNLMDVFNNETTLLNEPTLEKGILELVFNENILKDPSDSVLADEVMETLVRTLTEQDHVEAIEVKVENVEMILNENGEVYDKPVTSEVFLESEKL